MQSWCGDLALAPGVVHFSSLGRLLFRSGCTILAAASFLSPALFANGAAHFQNSSSAAAQQPSPESPQEITLLEAGKPVEGEIAGGQKRFYRFELSAGQYAKIEFKWQDTDLGISLQMPDGKTNPLQDPLGTHRQFTLEQVAEFTEIYRINVYTRTRAPAGRYEIRIAELHLATENEQILQQGRNLFREYVQLRRVGKLAEGRPLLIRALEIREKVLGPDSLLVAETLSTLANNYQSIGDSASAESNYQRALEITERALGPDHPDVAYELQHLGYLYHNMGNDLKAEQMYQRSLSIFEKAGRTENLIVDAILVDLGRICLERGDYQSAESFYQRSRAIQEKLLGPDHFHLSFSFARLGRVAYDAADYSKAEAMFQRALALTEKALGQDHIELTGRLNDLAMLYSATGDYATARGLYERALSTHERQKAMSDPKVRETLFGLARLYAAQGMPPEAVIFQSRAIELEEHYLELNLAAGSEREKLAFLATMSDHSSQNISIHTDLSPNDPTARNLAVTTILQRKGRAQDAMSGGLSALRQRSGPGDQKLLDQLDALTSRLARLVLSGPMNVAPAQHQEQINTLEQQRDELEAEISRRTAGFYQRSKPVTLAAVQAAVPEKAALIEFAVYRPFDAKAPDNPGAYGEPHYVAYVIRNQGDVRWTELGLAKEIDNAVDSLRQALRDPRRKDMAKLARSVDEKVMRPVRALTGDATQLLISADGELNLIPFEALIDEWGHYLAVGYSLSYLTSGRDLLRMQVVRESKSKPLLIANPLFGEPAGELSSKISSAMKPTRSEGKRRSITTGSDLSDVYFAPLGGTGQEARAIQALFPQARMFIGEQATKAALKGVDAPSLLHIATHGFFLRDAQAQSVGSGVNGTRAINVSTKIKNPLLRSGLALAGANLNKGRGDDGILTALEASNLDLWGTKLVTLSACDTGVGEVKNGEGVYGLRRAFFLAGTESLVMSLWPVSDSVTRELMTEYYAGLKKGLGRGEALRQAQLGMLKRKGRQHPFYWASFIQAGEWANLDGQR